MSCTLDLLSNEVAYYDAAPRAGEPRAAGTRAPALVASVVVAALGLCAGIALASFGAPATQLKSAPPATATAAARSAVLGGLVGGVARAPAAAAEPGPAHHALAALHDAPLAKIGFVVEDAPKLDIPDDVLRNYILAAALPLFGLFFWIYSGAAAGSDGLDADGDFGPSGIYKVEGNIPTTPEGWRLQAEALKARGFDEGLTGAELVKLSEEGKAVIVDVRGSDKFARGSIKGAVNVQLFRRIEGWTVYKAVRRFQFALFGQVGTEFNPDFLAEFRAKVGAAAAGKRVVFVDDNTLGTLQSTIAFPHGKCCHALMAAYYTGANGYGDVDMQFLEGGVILYQEAGGEVVGTLEPPFMRV